MAARFRVMLIVCVVIVCVLAFLAWRLDSEISRSKTFDCADARHTYEAITMLAEAYALPLDVADITDVELASVLELRNAQRVREASKVLDELGPEPDC
jgi:hypothetical protein